MKKYLLILLLAPIFLTSCYHYAYLKKDVMEGFNDQNIKQAQFYMDRKVKIKGKFTTDNNVVTDGKVTVVKTKHNDKLRIKKGTLGQVVKRDRDDLIVAFGQEENLTFRPENGKNGIVYKLQVNDVRPKGGKESGYTTIGGHQIAVNYNARKFAFRHGKFSDKPALIFKKRTKKVHKRVHETASGVKV